MGLIEMAGQQAAQMQNQLNDAGAKVDWRVARKQPEGNHVSGKIEPSGAAASTDEIRVKNLGTIGRRNRGVRKASCGRIAER